jgi:D-3-phosphoglycerate dehydrogenase / 2-oxoglutarate reductase
MPFNVETSYCAIRPYLVLAERIGVVLFALARGPIRRLEVEYRGEEVDGLIKPLTVALLKGIFTHDFGDTVNYVNAPLVAAECRIQITQAKGLHIGDYSNRVSCQATLEDGEAIRIAGTLLDHRDPYIVRINDYKTDFVPEGHMLLMGSYDKPGVIGRVGMLLAENEINIAGWYTGRISPGGNTLTVLSLDMPLPETILDELRKLDFVRHALQVKI